MEKTLKGNWVGLDTVFYNASTGKTSSDITEVIDFSSFEIDREGLAAYLDYGYCVFGHTPIKQVKYLLPYQQLRVDDGVVEVVDGEDKTLKYLGQQSQEDDVMDLLINDVNAWSSRSDGNILIPTSGGFDSRLLNLLLIDKSRIHSYTYGTSKHQGNSREVVYAKELSRRLGTQWVRVDLGKFNAYQNDWYDAFGCSVAANGTYHMEFFEQIKRLEHNKRLPLLSGIIGDAWAGAVQIGAVSNAAAYKKLGHTHGMSADAALAMNSSYMGLVEQAYDRQKDLLKDADYRIIATMRTKMMLLKSLMTIPDRYGFEAYSPFVKEEIAMAMLNLPAERRQDRIWQRDFFKKNDVLFESEKHNFTYQNSLNYYALTNHKLALLDIDVLREEIDVKYLEWINNSLRKIGFGERIYQTLMHTPKVKGVMKLMGFGNSLIRAFFAYTTLKPIEKLLVQRNTYGRY